MLFIIYLLVQASSFFVCLGCYNSVKKTQLKYFLPFLFITGIVEATAYWIPLKGISKFNIFNTFTTFEFVFYFFIFSKHLKLPYYRYPVIAMIFIYPITVYLNLKYIQGFHTFHSYTFLLGSFFMVLFSCLFFFESVRLENLHKMLPDQPFFWVCTAFIMFYLGSVVINSLFQYLMSFDMQSQGKRIYSIINQS
ncbi:MAG: hypothetical protein EAZ41_01690, partial [Sphingobacteriia bacterium]